MPYASPACAMYMSPKRLASRPWCMTLAHWQIANARHATLECKTQLLQERERRLMGPTRNVEAQRRAFRAAGTRALEAQPACLRGGELRDYQLDGVVGR